MILSDPDGGGGGGGGDAAGDDDIHSFPDAPKIRKVRHWYLW